MGIVTPPTNLSPLSYLCCLQRQLQGVVSTSTTALDGAAQVWSSAGAAAASSAGKALAALMGVGTELQARLRNESEARQALQAQVGAPGLWGMIMTSYVIMVGCSTHMP
jgi:hypothetical protein